MKRILIFLVSLFSVFAPVATEAQTTYATLNPSDKGTAIVLSNGNLSATTSAYAPGMVRANMGKSSGKWFFEVTPAGITDPNFNFSIGVVNSTAPLTDMPGSDANGWAFWGQGDKFTNGLANVQAYLTVVPVNGDVWGFAVDMTAGTIKMYVNGVDKGVMFSGLTGTLYPAFGNFNCFDPKVTFNFGATAFAYSVPSGYNAGWYTSSGNAPPTANAGSDQVITLPTSTTTLDASGSADSDGSITAYSWTKVSGPAGGTIASPTSTATSIASLQAGVYIYQVQVTDNSGATATDQVQVTVNVAGNTPPTANAGADQIINLPTSTTSLSGGGTDPDGTITSYAWTKISGPTGGTIASPSSATTAISALVAGTYIYRLTVTDNNGATGTDDVQLTVVAAGSHVKYVSKTGNNTTGDGSIGNPWLTVYKATSTVTTPGDTIHVMSGTYLETNILNLAIGVSLEGDDKNTTVIQSTAADGTNTAMLGLLTNGTNVFGNQTIRNLKFDGRYVSETSKGSFWGVSISRSNVDFHDCIITGFYDRGVLYTHRGDWGSPWVETVPPLADFAVNNKFHDNIVTNCATFYPGYGTGCLNIGGQKDMLIYNNTIQQNERVVGKNGWPIKQFLSGAMLGLKFYNNTVIKIPWVGTYNGDQGWNFAWEAYNLAGTEVYNNTFSGGSCDFNDNWLGPVGATYTYCSWFHDNVFSMPAMQASYHGAIQIEFDSPGLLVEKNIMYNHAAGIFFSTRANTQHPNVIIRNNLMYNLGRTGGNGNNGTGIGIYSESTNDCDWSNLQIYNNTIVAKSGMAPWFGLEFNAFGAGSSLAGANIKNNIIQGFWGNWFYGSNMQYMTNFKMEYNNVYGNGNSNAIQTVGTPGTGYSVANNTTNVPGFVNEAGADYTLATGSANIDAGINVGLPYNGTAPDKGYKESGTATQNYLQWDPLNSYYEQINTSKGIRSTFSSGYSALGKGTASSIQTISSGEAVVFDAQSTTNFFAVGLSTWKPISHIYDDVVGEDSVKFGVIMGVGDSAYAYEVGIKEGPSIKIAIGNLIRINYVGSTILYQLSTNGGTTYTTFWTSQKPALGRYYVIFHSPSAGGGPNNIFKEGVVVNQPPVVNAGPDLSTTLPINTATLNGLAYDPDGSLTTTVWTKVSGPSGGSIINSNNDTTQITGLQAGTYVYRLSATDNNAASTSDDMILTVAAGDPNGSTSLATTIIPLTDPEVFSHGRGAEQWNDQNYVKLPTETGAQTIRKDLYFRWWWAELETGNNVFNWTEFDNVINSAIANGQTFSFGIMSTAGVPDTVTNGLGQRVVNTGWHSGVQPPRAGGGYMNYPLYLHNLMQLETTNNRDWLHSSGEWVPNYNSPNYLARTKNLYDSVYNHIATKSFNGVAYKNVINYIDLRQYGSWGEWNQSNYITQQTDYPTGRQPLEASLDSIISYIARPTLPYKVVIGVAAFDAQQLPNTWIPPGTTWWALTRQTLKGLIGWRRDQWGALNTQTYVRNWTDLNVKTYNGMRFDTAIMNRYRYAPIVGEPPGFNSGDVPDMKNLPTEVRFYKAASFGNGNIYTGGTYDPNFLTQGTRDSVRQASKEAGYRIQLEGGFSSSTVTIGSSFSVLANWRNAGLTPIYDPYFIVYQLRNGNTVVWTDTSDFRIYLLQPSTTATSYTDNFTIPNTVSSGTYDLYVVLKDSLGYRTPVGLANQGRGTDGAYLIRSGIPLVLPAGNQAPTVSINNPNGNTVYLQYSSSDTLTASANDPDGTISSYLWTKVSGPTGGTIVTPTGISTRITGLTAGIYNFQVVVTDNGGATATANVVLTVVAAPVVTNILPVVTVSRPRSIAGTSLTVSGSATDADGTIVSYQWTQVAGLSTVSFGTPTATTTNITNINLSGLYIFRLSATDNQGGVGYADIRVLKSNNKILVYK